MKKERQFYTYLHCNENKIPFYVGKGHGNRAYNGTSRGIKWKRYTKKHPFIPENTIIYLVDSENQAFELEKELIWLLTKSLGLWLANATDGGEGASGYQHTPEAKEKIRIAKEGVAQGPLSEGHKKKLSLVMVGKPKPPISEKTREKQRLAHLGKKLPQKTKDKQRLANLGRKYPPATKEKGEKISKSLTGKKATEQTKAKLSAGQARRRTRERFAKLIENNLSDIPYDPRPVYAEEAYRKA